MHLVFKISDEIEHFFLRLWLRAFANLLRLRLNPPEFLYDVGDFSFHRLGDDAVFLIILGLDGTAPVRLVDGVAYGVRLLVGIQQYPAANVSSRSSNCLNQRGSGSQEAFLIRIQHRDQ